VSFVVGSRGRGKKTCEDEEDEVEELETVEDETPDDCEEEIGGWAVDDDGDEGGREVVPGVSGVVVGETTELEGSTVTLGGAMSGTEDVEVVCRLCNQCRFSSTS